MKKFPHGSSTGHQFRDTVDIVRYISKYPVKTHNTAFYLAGISLFASMMLFLSPGCAPREESVTDDDGNLPEAWEIREQHIEVEADDLPFPEKPKNFPAVPESGMSLEEHHDWAHWNVHDPDGIQYDGWYYVFSTDVAHGYDPDAGGLGDYVGLQIRRSRDLIEWEFVGWVFDAIPEHAADYVERAAGTAPTNMWAPHITRVDDEFRLYYTVSRIGTQNSVIGLAVADHPEGPWEDRGAVLKSSADAGSPVNAIDASVVVHPDNNRMWMIYGSYWDGIYSLELSADDGLPAEDGYGSPVVRRASAGDSIEAPAPFYSEEQGYWYLFFSYGWLEDTYRILVARAESPDGPWLDRAGNDMAERHDGGELVVAPYRFVETIPNTYRSEGWQGTGHPGLIHDDDENAYLLHNARPGRNPHWTQLHARRIYWDDEGWPLVMPSVYSGEERRAVATSEIEGKWDVAVLHPDLGGAQARSAQLQLLPNGVVEYGNRRGTWAQSGESGLKLQIGTQIGVATGITVPIWDRERGDATLGFSGRTNDGIVVWGKRVSS